MSPIGRSEYNRFACVVLTALFAFAQPSLAAAAEISVAAGAGIKAVLDALAPDFERSSGHKLRIRYGSGGDVKNWVRGDPPDVAIIVRPILDDLLKQGRIEPDTSTNIARTFVGIAVRTGAPKPDITSPEAVRHTLLSAKSIAYPDPAIGSASALHFSRVLDRLSLTEELRGKTKLVRGASVAAMLAEMVAKGEAELAVSQLSELMPHTKIGIEIVGPLPPDLQDAGAFTIAAGLIRGAKEPDAARTFIRFISAPTIAPLLKANGMEPG